MRSLLLALALHVFVGAPLAAHASNAPALWARCAVCHQPDGNGIPGIFPPLREHLGAFAASAKGRAYLVLVPTHGLLGAIEVAGLRYQSAMPAQPLEDDELALLLNHMLEIFPRALPQERAVAPFDRAEVAAIRAAHPKPAPGALLALRAELLP